MSSYLFQLGNTPRLSFAEIQCLIGTPSIVVGDLLVEAETTHTAQELIRLLGGTVKIFEKLPSDHLSQLDPSNTEALEAAVTETFKTMSDGKLHFFLAELGRDHLDRLSIEQIKDNLLAEGITSRYVDGSRHGLSAAVLSHQRRVQEVTLINTPSGQFLAKTVAVQDVDDWTNRDRNKPYADRKKGMLPPKVARMMVNLALGPDPTPNSVLLDPFCGSGTILMEALLRGCECYGSDVDATAVAGTLKNLAWLSEEYNLDGTYDVVHAEAAHVKPSVKITHLVTEPFLGKPQPKTPQLPNIFRGLEKQYLGAFKHWQKILANGATLVVVFPEVSVPGKNKRFSLEALIDKLPSLGYTTLSEPVLYYRPHAIVQRAIYQFRYK